MYFDLKRHGENLNAISRGMSIAVEQRLKSERLKTELITNVSHDIKTPLTSIVNYVDLLQREHTPEQEREYLAVLDRQAHKLKKLTVDLVEMSKASTGNIPCHLARRSVRELIDQTVGEYAEKLSAARLEPVGTISSRTPASMPARARGSTSRRGARVRRWRSRSRTSRAMRSTSTPTSLWSALCAGTARARPRAADLG